MSAAPDALVGRVLGGTYRVERKLGEGGMGAVFAARNVRTGKPYAVKVLLPELGRRKEALARFEREAKALAALGHLGIVAIHDFATEPDGLAFLVMDQLEGEELGQRIKASGRLAPETAVHLAIEIASALAAAHSLGIVHRDLKPSNVFLTRRAGGPERAVILDFGLARSVHGGEAEGLGKVTSSGVVMGTPHYMSPEQAQGTNVDARSDVYALGAMLFEMLSGRPPFEGPSLAMLFALLVTTDAPTLVSIGVPVAPALDALVHSCLEKDPARRPASAEELAARLAAFPHRAADVRGDDAALARTIGSGAFAMSPTREREPAPATRISAPIADHARSWLATVVALLAGCVVFIAAVEGLVAYTHMSPVRTPIVRSMEGSSEPDSGADAFIFREDAALVAIDAHVEIAAAPARRVRAPRSPLPEVSSGPPGVTPPPGIERIQAAAARLGEGDPAGCLRELRTAPETAQVLGMRMSCANSAHDHASLAAACARLHARFPESAYTRTCDVLLGE